MKRTASKTTEDGEAIADGMTLARGQHPTGVDKAQSPGSKAPPSEVIERGTAWELRTTGLVLNEKIGVEEWSKVGVSLTKRYSAISWALGDHINFGANRKDRFREKYEEALRNSGLSFQALRDICWVCSKVKMSLRRDTLKFGHHREVASLGAEEQTHWLGEAEQHGWSVEQLRRRLRPVKLRKQTEDGIPRFRTVTGIVVAFHKWARYKKRTPHGPDAFAATLTTEEAKNCRDKLKVPHDLFQAVVARLRDGPGKKNGTTTRASGTSQVKS
jgi:hypothetical protein